MGSALLLGQLQTGAAPVLEHAGLGVLVCDDLELCIHRHSCQVGNSAAVLQGDLCTGDIEFIRRSNEHRLQIHIMVGHGEVHHACGALLLGQLQTGAAPALEHAGLGVLVCGGLELCTHRHSLQVGNSAAILQGDRCIGDIEFIGLGSVLGVLCFQCDLVCGHREGDGRLSGVHVSGQTGHFPTGEGVTVLLGCGGNELCTHGHSCQVGNSAAVLQGDLCIGDLELIGLGSVLGVLCLQRDVICGHREGDGRLSGVHVCGQTGHFPTGEGVTVLLVCGEAEFLSCNVLGRLVIHGQGVLFGHNIGAYPIDYVIIIGAGVFNIVLTRRHLDVHIVAAGGGGNSFALVGAVQQGHLRVGIVIICAIVFHRVLGGIVGKVLSLGRVAERLLTQLNRTGLVLSAFLCSDGYLIAAIRIGYLVGKVVGKDLTLIYTGNALKLSRKLANAVCLRADHRIGAVLVLDAVKVIQRKALKGQLFGYGVVIRQQVISA